MLLDSEYGLDLGNGGYGRKLIKSTVWNVLLDLVDGADATAMLDAANDELNVGVGTDGWRS
jgi:hypothetical protein